MILGNIVLQYRPCLLALSLLVLAGCQNSKQFAETNGASGRVDTPLPYIFDAAVRPASSSGMRVEERLPPDAGAFMKCAACHNLTRKVHGIGPSLKGAYGKPAARLEKYRYSNALRESGLVWDAATLDRFLADPDEVVPGTKMPFRGLKDPADRAQVIALMERYAD